MKRFWTTLTFASLFFGFTQSTAQAWTVLWFDDFETPDNSRSSGTNVIMTREAAPLSSGTAMLFSDIGNTSNWGAELSANGGANGSRIFRLSDYGAVAGVDRVLYSFNIFIPENSVLLGDDSFGPYVRFVTDEGNDGGNASGNSNNIKPNTLERGVWHTIQREFAIPLTANNNQTGGTGTSPTTRIALFVSFNDVAAFNDAGPLFYIDNIQAILTPEPSHSLLAMAGLGALLLSRRRHA